MTDAATQEVAEQVKELTLKEGAKEDAAEGVAAEAATAANKTDDAATSAAAAGATEEAAEEAKLPLDLTKYGVHSGITCDGCKKKSFLGYRWKCIKCKNHDLCDACHGE